MSRTTLTPSTTFSTTGEQDLHRRRKARRAEEIPEETEAENLTFGKNCPEVEEADRAPNRVNPEPSKTHHKLTKTEEKGKT